MFIVARMLEASGEEVLAAKLLRGIVDMSRGVPECRVIFPGRFGFWLASKRRWETLVKLSSFVWRLEL